MNKILIGLLCTAVAVCSGCYKDKSNDVFINLNTLTVSDAATADLITVQQGDTLRLSPAVTQSVEKGDGNLVYEWKIYENGPAAVVNAPNIVIAKTRHLAIAIKEPLFSLGFRYRLVYTVTDSLTGISRPIYYNLEVSNQFREGWMLLEDKAAGADLSMILPGERIVRNVYSDRNAATPLTKPKRLELFNFILNDNLVNGKRIYILTENGGVSLNPQTLVKYFDYKDLFFGAPAVMKPQNLNWTFYRYGNSVEATLGVIIDNNKVYTNYIGGFPGVMKWGGMLLTPEETQHYSAAPFIIGGDLYPVTYPAIIYDNIGKRFLYTGSTTLRSFPPATSTVFDLNNVGMDMVYMDSTNVFGQYVAIMKNAAGDPYLLGFKGSSTPQAPALTLKKELINDPNILQMKTAAASTLTPHLYYTTGNKIYTYEISSNTVANTYSFPAGEEVTRMVFRRVTASGPQLAVSTWNGTEGKLYLFPVDVIGGITNYSKQYGGFNKIVDFGYKLP